MMDSLLSVQQRDFESREAYESAVFARRAAARAAQAIIDQRRLEKHQRALALLSDEQQRDAILAAAHREINAWESKKVCSREYVVRWRAWLLLPLPALATEMLSMRGWAPAMRQNSPFFGARFRQ